MIVYNNQAPDAVNNVGQFGATEGSIGAYKQAAEYAADSKYWALLAESKFGTIDDLIAEVERLYQQGVLMKQDIEDLKQDFIDQDARLMSLIAQTNAAVSDANNAVALINQKLIEVQKQLDVLLGMSVDVTTLPPGTPATGSFNPTTGVISLGIPEGDPGKDGSVKDLDTAPTGVPELGDLGFYVDKDDNTVHKTTLENIANLIPSVRSVSVNGGPALDGEVALTINKETVGLGNVLNVAQYSRQEINDKFDKTTKTYQSKAEADADAQYRQVGEKVLVWEATKYEFYTVAANKTLTPVKTEGRILTVNSRSPDSSGNIDITIPTGNPSLYLGEMVMFPYDPTKNISYPGVLPADGRLVSKESALDLGPSLVSGQLPVVSETEWQGGARQYFSWGKLADGVTDADSTNFINIRLPDWTGGEAIRSPDSDKDANYKGRVQSQIPYIVTVNGKAPDDANGNVVLTAANVGAAASGANSDITSLDGLTTPLSIAQGGTGASDVGNARVSLNLQTFHAINGVGADLYSSMSAPDGSKQVRLTNSGSFRLVDQSNSNTIPFALEAGGTGAVNDSEARSNLKVDRLVQGPSDTKLLDASSTRSFFLSGNDWGYSLGSDRIGLPITSGGTGATTEVAARTNLKVDKLVQSSSDTKLLDGVGDHTFFLSGNDWGYFNNTDSSRVALPIISGGTGASTASQGWINLLDGRTAGTARNDLGLGSLATLSAVSKDQLNGDLARGTMFAAGSRNNSQGAGVWTYDNASFGWGEQYATCIQVSNRPNADGVAGTGIWQHYLALCTSGNIVYGLNINGNYSSHRVWSSNNTTVDGSGFVKQASPVVRVVTDVDSMTPNFLEGFTLSGSGSVNDEAEGAVVSKIGTGKYSISGTTGLYPDGWQIEVPKDVNGNRLCFVEVSFVDGLILINSFKPKLDLDTGGIKAGDAIDIPIGRWVDVRVGMPAK